MTPEDPYPEIGRILAASATGSWKTLVLDAALGDDWARFRAVAVNEDDQQRGISLQEIPRLRELFQVLRTRTRAVADPGLPDWTTARFSLRRNGRFAVDFGYEPLSTGM